MSKFIAVNRLADRLLDRFLHGTEATAQCTPTTFYRCTNNTSSLCNGNWHVNLRCSRFSNCNEQCYASGCCPA